jgi:hypothetical protein
MIRILFGVLLFNMYSATATTTATTTTTTTTIRVYLKWSAGCRKSQTHTLTLCILLLYKLEGQSDVQYQ